MYDNKSSAKYFVNLSQIELTKEQIEIIEKKGYKDVTSEYINPSDIARWRKHNDIREWGDICKRLTTCISEQLSFKPFDFNITVLVKGKTDTLTFMLGEMLSKLYSVYVCTWNEKENKFIRLDRASEIL